LAFENQPARQGIEIGQLAVIKRLGVDPLWQSKGIGRLLLQEAIRLVREQMGQVPALVMIEDLHEARVLYQSEGAKMIGDFQEDGGNRMLSLVF
jgi:GNAT superfamily N-acetyltransferase